MLESSQPCTRLDVADREQVASVGGQVVIGGDGGVHRALQKVRDGQVPGRRRRR